MIKYYNPLGKVSLTNKFFEELIGYSVEGCYGVVGTTAVDTADSVMSFLLGEKMSQKGVEVRVEDNRLVIELHVRVLYGVNMEAISGNIRERVTYAVESSTDMKIKRIDIFVDDIVTE